MNRIRKEHFLLENASLCIKILYKNSKSDFETNLSKKTLQDYNSALIQYISFLTKTEVLLSKKEWSDKCKEEEEEVYKIAHHINGTDSLLRFLNIKDPLDFVKIVLSASYFFCPEDVKARFKDISELYIGNNKIEARWTESYLKKYPKKDYPGGKKDIINQSSNRNTSITYTVNTNNGKKEIQVKIDKDGNKAVRDLIKTITGHKVSQGIDSTFHFYKISHIWGNASDPRYFTNLWNIVLVPAWANDLLDKTNSREPLTVAFRQIIKYVCIKYYDMDNNKWADIDMDCPNYLNPNEEIDYIQKYSSGNLTINVFKKKQKNAEFAKIDQVPITIE